VILLVFFLCLVLGLNTRYYHLLCLPFLILVLIFIIRKSNKTVFVFALSFFVLGIGISFINFSFTQEQYSGIVIESKENYFIFESKLEKLYVYSKNNEYEIGDNLSIKGNKSELSFTKLESSFDFKDYLNKKGVYSQLTDTKISINYLMPLRIRKIKEDFLNGLNENAKGLASSILFGDSVSDSISKNTSSLHIGRLLSVSGIYIYAFFGFFRYLLSFKIKEKWNRLISIVLLLIYGLFVFPKFSCIKILLILIMRWINDYLLKRKFDYFTILSFSGFLFLIIDYHYAYQDGFILGYLIPIFFTIVSSSFSFKKKYIKKIVIGLLVSIFFIPFELSYYHELNIFSPIYQLILSPVFILFAFTSLLNFIGLPINSFTNYFSNGLIGVTSTLSQYTFAIYAPEFNEFFLLAFYALYFVLLYYRSISFKLMNKITIFSLISFIGLYALPIKNVISEEVNFINVGQGDCCLIRKGTTTILIDTGGSKYNDIALDSLIPYFKSKRIYNIDLVIATHGDYDHIGAYESLKTNFHVKEYIDDHNSFPLTRNNITLLNYNKFPYLWEEENDYSLVIGFKLCSQDFLIMGDAPKKIENKIMKENKTIPCDILKVGHHGSSSSTSSDFINYLKPKEAVISVGKNYYGHPNNEVINILEKYNVKIKRTDINGTIVY